MALAFACALGCGGGGPPPETEPEPAAQSSGGEDPTDGGRRRAEAGASCDYGGAAERTCQRGLYCCYGPPDDPGEHGECMPECVEY